MEGAQSSSPNACMRPQKPSWHSTGSEKAQSVITNHGASMPLLRSDPVFACGIAFRHMECCRWAMLAAAGILFVDLLGHLGAGGPAAATPWFKASDFTYFAPTSTLFIVELILFAWVEVRRYQDMMKPGRCAAAPKTHLHKLTISNFLSCCLALASLSCLHHFQVQSRQLDYPAANAGTPPLQLLLQNGCRG